MYGCTFVFFGIYFSLHQFHSTFVMSFIARMLANILFTCTWHLIGLIVPTYDDWLVFHCPCCQCPSFASVSQGDFDVGYRLAHWCILLSLGDIIYRPSSHLTFLYFAFVSTMSFSVNCRWLLHALFFYTHSLSIVNMVNDVLCAFSVNDY